MSSFSDTKLFDLTIYTPTKIFFSNKVKSVSVPSMNGRFQVLVNHAPVMASLDSGAIEVIDLNDSKSLFFVESGTAELHSNVLTITTTTIDKVSELDIKLLQSELATELENLKNTEDPTTKININKQISILQNKIKLCSNI